ncbi:hypothetical protein [Aeromicrobium fastidiosum]|nr:hypothetical protein [Aeromicrobium fastidiosum]
MSILCALTSFTLLSFSSVSLSLPTSFSFFFFFLSDFVGSVRCV